MSGPSERDTPSTGTEKARETDRSNSPSLCGNVAGSGADFTMTLRTDRSARRRLLLLAALGTLIPQRIARARECDVCGETARLEDDEVLQPARPSPAAYMQIAAELRERAAARGEIAMGAVIALENIVLAVGSPHVQARHDPTSHAEMEAIRMACKRHATTDLSGAVLYVTGRPCRMCETAAFHARIGRIVYGDAMIDAGAPRPGD